MTDRETIRAMLTRAGLAFTEGTRGPDHYQRGEGVTGVVFDAIAVEDQGYFNFVSEFWFDQATGALKHMAAWE